MKVVIIEDEIPATIKLRKMLQGFSLRVEIVKELASVQESINWFQNNNLPDLIFMDIKLSDGLSFDLIEKANISCPIIFITAFDEYWQEAFEYNSIDYLLKPLKIERLETSLNKFSEIRDYFTSRYQNLLAHQKNNESKFKNRFLVRWGKEFVSIKTEDIAFFYATHKLVCIIERGGAKYLLDTSVLEIEKQINPDLFFRINRKYLINKNSIARISTLSKSKLLIEINPTPPDELIISSKNSGGFKFWMSK